MSGQPGLSTSVSAILLGWFGVVVTSAGLVGCRSQGGTAEVDTVLVAVETPVIAEFAAQVAGERATIFTLIPPGQDPHTYQPSSQVLRTLPQADLVLLNGANLAPGVERLVESQVPPERVVVVSGGLSPLVDDAGEVDPHFWLSVPHAVAYVEAIRDALIRVDPAGEQTYAQNARALVQRLEALDTWIRAQVATVPPERRLLVTTHRVLGYFAEEYGFTHVGTVMPGVSTEAEPSAADLRRLIEMVQAHQVPAIFVEQGVNPALADQVARATGARVVTGLVDQPDPNREEVATYEAMMRHNVTLLVENLR
ncbi:MAG: metal ABC transporter substrate-binding protein [Ardenticatenia bacterium]|nr:metal ABC transporter substrate-binding protein [Ardenticatenia bacterium]